MDPACLDRHVVRLDRRRFFGGSRENSWLDDRFRFATRWSLGEHLRGAIDEHVHGAQCSRRTGGPETSDLPPAYRGDVGCGPFFGDPGLERVANYRSRDLFHHPDSVCFRVLSAHRNPRCARRRWVGVPRPGSSSRASRRLRFGPKRRPSPDDSVLALLRRRLDRLVRIVATDSLSRSSPDEGEAFVYNRKDWRKFSFLGRRPVHAG